MFLMRILSNNRLGLILMLVIFLQGLDKRVSQQHIFIAKPNFYLL
jgi:hypothetical protein